MYASLHDAVRFSMKAELEKSYSKADLSKQKWNSLVSCSQHLYSGICPFGWWGGGVSGRVLAVKRLTFNVMHIASGVTVSIHHFALLINTRISLVYLELPLASEPRGISSKSCKALSFSRFQLVPAILFFTGTREIFTRKPWHVLVWQRLCITPPPPPSQTCVC